MAILFLLIFSSAVNASGTYKLPTKINDEEIQRRLAILCKRNPQKIICKKLKAKDEPDQKSGDKN